MRLIDAQFIADRKYSEARRLYTTLRNPELITTHERLEKEGDQNALQEFGVLVHEGRYGGLQAWVKKYRERSLADLPVKELRVIASSYGIPMYYRKTKAELIQLVRYAQERPRKCKYCGDRHPELACEKGEFEIF
jgi:hypothetical protein